MEKKICVYCGKDFIPTHNQQKYCCQEHRIQDSNDRAKSKRTASIIGKTMKCACCGKEFVAKAANSKYCSKECATSVVYKNAKEVRLARKRGKTCAMCGKPLGEFHSSVYCSKECSEEARRRYSLANEVKPKKPRKPKKPVLSISEINTLALAEHLSYGEYVMKYGV